MALTNAEAQSDLIEQQLRQQQQYAQQRAPTFEETIQSMPLTESEREWLREHPTALTDPVSQRRLEVAYADSQRDNLVRGSPRYRAALTSMKSTGPPARSSSKTPTTNRPV